MRTVNAQNDISSTNLQSVELPPVHQHHAYLKLTQLVFLFCFFQGHMLIFISFMAWQYRLLVLVSQFWILDVFVFIYLAFLRFKYRIIFGYLIVDMLISAIYKLLILMHFEYSQLKMDYFAYILMGYYLIRVLVVNVRKISKREVINTYKLLVQGIKLLLVLQLMIATLRATQTLKWNWYSVFSITWGLLIIGFIIHFVFFLSVGEALIDYARNKINPSQLIGSVWFTTFLSGFSAFPMWFLLELCWFLEDDRENRFNTLIKMMILMVTIDLIIIISAIMLKRHLKIFLDISPEQQKPSETIEKKSAYTYLKIHFPVKLIQISTTYFDFAHLESKQRTTSINASIVNQKSKLKAFEFMAKTEQINSPVDKEDYILRNDEKCQICFEYDHNVVFLPCQHGGLCELCAEKCLKKSKNCYLCRDQITKVLRVTKGDKPGSFQVKDFAHLQQ